VRRLEFALTKASLSGSLAPASNQTNYDLTISLDLRGLPEPEGLSLTMSPMYRGDGSAGEAAPMQFGQLNHTVFANIAEADISRFVAFIISAGKEPLRHFLLQYEISGLPPTRLDRIVKEIVSNTDQFFEYLRFLLMDDFFKSDLERFPADHKQRLGSGDDAFFAPDLPLFERMLEAASRDPEKMRAVDGVIQRLKTTDKSESPLIPPAFLDFWEVFRPLIPSGKGKGADNGH
jgi:hypothetical protein